MDNRISIGGSKYVRMKFMREWFLHVKRRPSIAAVVNLEAVDIHERWKKQAKLDPMDPRNKMPSRYELKISPEEQRIIDTPIEQLMEEYEKTLK